MTDPGRSPRQWEEREAQQEREADEQRRRDRHLPVTPELTVLAEYNDAGANRRVMSDATIQQESRPGVWKWRRDASSAEYHLAKSIKQMDKLLDELGSQVRHADTC